jgi:hypothetical protein
MILQFTSALISYPPDIYFKLKFNYEIKKNNVAEKMFYFYNVPTFWDDNIFEIGLELKNGKRILVRVEDSIYNVHGILEIDKYKIETLELENSGTNAFLWWDGISYTNGLKHWLLEILLNKSDRYFCDLNNYINCYDEIKKIFEKIYYEPRIPGSKNDVTREHGQQGDTSKWETDDELANYTGYIIIDGTDKAKIYVSLIDKNHE